MTKTSEKRPKRGMILGIAVGLVLAGALLMTFYNRVQQPAVGAKPAQPPRVTQQ